jgi:hypothetical protein
MTQKYENSVLDVADSLASSGALPDRWSIEKELEARGYALARRLFDDARRGERLDRMCAEARKKQPTAKTRPGVLGAPRTHYSLPQR